MDNSPSGKSHLAITVIVSCIALAFLAYTLRSLLFTGDGLFIHESFHWYYPNFQYFVDNLAHGYYPLWNPYSNGGEPFYPFIVFQLLNPIIGLVILIGRWFTQNAVLLFNWNFFISVLVTVSCIYFALRPFVKFLTTRLSLILILLLSSVFFCSFRSIAIIDCFIWTPIIAHCLIRIFYWNDYHWKYWLLSSGLIGLYWQAYRFGAIAVFLLFFFVSFLLFYRDRLFNVFKAPRALAKFLVSAVIVLSMMVPNLILYLEQSDYTIQARMYKIDGKQTSFGQGMSSLAADPSFQGGRAKLSYKGIEDTGTFATIADFLHTLDLRGVSHNLWPNDPYWWGRTSEAWMYMGIFTWVIALFGMITAQHPLRKLFLFMAISFALFILGPAGGLHRLLYLIYPPAHFERHVMTYVLYFLFPVLFFYVLGMDHLISKIRDSAFTRPFAGLSVRAINFRSLFIYTSILVLVVSFLTKLQYPHTRYIFLYFLLLTILGWYLFARLKQWGLFLSILSAQIILVLILSGRPVSYLAYLCLIISLPLIAYVLRCLKGIAVSYFVLAFLISLVADLVYNLYHSDFLYKSQKSPAIACGIDTTIHKPLLAQTKQVSATQCLSSVGGSMRYLGMAHRKADVLSASKDSSKKDFQEVLESERWNSLATLRHYFQLIYSGLSLPAFEKIFRIDMAPVSFKPFAIEVQKEKSLEVLKETAKNPDQLDHLLVIETDQPKRLAFSKLSTVSKTYINSFSYTLEQAGYSDYSLKTKSIKPGYLYWADGFHYGWKAYLNDSETPIYRANLNFKAIALPAGENKIQFVFKPVAFYYSLCLFYLIFAIALFAALITQLSQAHGNSSVTDKITS